MTQTKKVDWSKVNTQTAISDTEKLQAEANWDTFEPYMDAGWMGMLFDLLFKEDMQSIFATIRERKSHTAVFPTYPEVFRAFKECEWDNLKVVILGQDPYHTYGTADGLAFSSGKNVLVCPPSLRNILKEVEDDVYNGVNTKTTGLYDLKRWANQGVLLLNTALTVEEGSPGAHCDIWEPFTTGTIKMINDYHTGNLVYMLWGNHAKSYKNLITNPKHLVLESGHPSPMSANKGKWFGNKHFTKANKYLTEKFGKSAAIEW